MDLNLRPRLRSALVLLLLCLLPFVLFWQQTLGRALFYHYDIQFYFFPYRAVVSEMFARGQLPLWNPYAFSGIPLLGDGQTAFFYPLNWLYWLAPSAHMLTLTILLHFSIAGVGTFLYCRCLRLGRLAATLAALAFMFNGYLVARVVHPSIMAGAALVPLLFWGVERLLQQPGPGQFSLAALVVGLQAMAGHPQVPIYTAVALGIYTLVLAARQARRGGRAQLWRLPLRLAGVYVVGYSLAAVQLLPWIDFARFSPRAASASFELVTEVLPITDWLLFLFPYGYGGMRPSWLYAGPQQDDLFYVWERLAYIGLLPLALASIGMAEQRRLARLLRQPAQVLDEPAVDDAHFHLDRLRALSVTLVVLLLIAMGANTPAGQLVYMLPVIGKLRGYMRALGVAVFPLVVFAAYGVEALRARVDGGQAARRAARRAALLLAGGLALVLLLVNLIPVSSVEAAVSDPLHRLMLGRYLRLSQPSALVPLLLAALGAGLLWWSGAGLSRLKAAALLLLTAIDCAGLAVTFNPTIEAGFYERVPASLAFLRSDPEVFRIANFSAKLRDPEVMQDQLAISWAMAYSIEDINGFNSLQPRRYTDFLFGTAQEDVSYGALIDESLLQPGSPQLPMLNVKYVLVQADMPVRPGPGWERVFADGTTTIYRSQARSERACAVARVMLQPDPAAILAAIRQPGFAPCAQSYVEGGMAPAQAERLASSAPAEVIYERRSPTQLLLHTRATAERFVVLSEMWFPGWYAELDGTALPVYRANYLFRGLVVPPGEHTIRMYYRPPMFLLGSALTAVTLVVLLALGTARRWRRRRAAQPSSAPA